MCETSARYKFGAVSVRLCKRRSFNILWHSLWIHKQSSEACNATSIKGKCVRCGVQAFKFCRHLLGATECALPLHSEPVIDFTYMYGYDVSLREDFSQRPHNIIPFEHLIFVFV